MMAKDIMTKDVITVGPEDTVETVINLLLDNRISGLPVVNEQNEVVGVVSEGDIIVRKSKLHIPSFIQILGGVIYLDDPEDFKEELRKVVAYKVKDIMSVPPATIEEDTTIEEMATILSEEGINRLPVVKENKLVGLVSRSDIVRALSRKE